MCDMLKRQIRFELVTATTGFVGHGYDHTEVNPYTGDLYYKHTEVGIARKSTGRSLEQLPGPIAGDQRWRQHHLRNLLVVGAIHRWRWAWRAGRICRLL